MDYVETALNPIYAQALKLTIIERFHATGKKLTVAEALILAFEKHSFSSPEDKANSQLVALISKQRDLQYLQTILDRVLNLRMIKGDVCSATIRLIHKRNDGLYLAYIEELTSSRPITEMKRSFSYGDGYDIEYDLSMPRLCIVDMPSLEASGYYLEFDDMPNYVTINFCKMGCLSSSPSYHYFNEDD